MNASIQATTIDSVSKISCIPVLFRSEFSSVIVDLRPWTMDEKTQKQHDPNSIDFAFSFPKWHPSLGCGSILLQVCFTDLFSEPNTNFYGVEAAGYRCQTQCWRFSTAINWQFDGDLLPSNDCQQQLRCIFHRIYALFGQQASLLQ